MGCDNVGYRRDVGRDVIAFDQMCQRVIKMWDPMKR